MPLNARPILKSVVFFGLLLCAVACTSNTNRIERLKHKKAVTDFREEKNRFFRTSQESPLLTEQQYQFKGLEYYPVDISYRVPAHYQRLPQPKELRIQTSTGHERIYEIIGKLDFTLSGKAVSLNAYQEKGVDPQYKSILFIPFMDRTNGRETYSAGRYLEVNEPGGDSVVLDFNLAYNPYCAYNYNFSCPIPPPENHIDLEVKAGEKVYPFDSLNK